MDAAKASDATPGRPVRRARREIRALLELTALSGLAIAQPVLDATGRAPEFFLFRRAGPVEIGLIVTVVVAGPPLLLWCLGLLAGLLGDRFRRTAHLVSVGGLTAVLAVLVGKHLLPVRGTALVVIAALVAAAVVAAHLRWAAVGVLLRTAAVGPLAFVLLFTFASPTSPMLLGAATGPAAGGGSAAGRPVGPHPPLVVIVFDEFPQLSLLDQAGRLDARHHPGFARLADDATWYRNATTLVGSTTHALPIMLTGRLPTRQAAPHYSQFPNNLFTLLADVYRMRVHESVVQLCPPEQCARPESARTGLVPLLADTATVLRQVVSPVDAPDNAEAGFSEPVVRDADEVLDPTASDMTFRWHHRTDNQPVRFREFVTGLRPSPEPTLHFLHLILPHQAFQHLPSGTRYPPKNRLRQHGPALRRFWHERHLLQVRYVDRLLDTVLDRLHQTGMYDEAMLMVTADHGISFNPATELRKIDPAQRNAAEIAWVPLFIKAPGQHRGRQDHRNWLHVDLVPTVADHAGVEVGWPVDGRSALRSPRPETAKPYYGRIDRPFQLQIERANAVVRAGPRALPYRWPTDPARPAAELLGRRVTDLPVVDGGPTAAVSDLDDLRAVDPAGGTVPAIVDGTLPASVPADARVAVALNGTVRAVVPTQPTAGGARRQFAAVIPDERHFRAGANRIDLLLVTAGPRTGAADRLLRLPVQRAVGSPG